MPSIALGAGVFHHGDCFDVMRTLPDASVDMIFTDPPYRTISGGTNSPEAFGWRTSVLAKNDGKIFEHNDVSIADYMQEFFRLLKPSSHCYVMTNNINLETLLCEARKVGFGFHNLLAWRKNTCTANRWYMKEMEWVCLFYKSPARRILNAGSKQIFEADNPTNKRHPTEKPVALVEHYLQNSLPETGYVLDPFAGSGTTAIAAQRTGRRWVCIERDDTYAALAIGRICGELSA